MSKNITAENFEVLIANILDKSNDILLKCIDKVMDKSNENLEMIIEISNKNLAKTMEKCMSNSVTDCMKELHSAMSTLGASVSKSQQQGVKLNISPMLETMTMALWTVERGKKDEERRSQKLRICVTLNSLSAAENLIASSKIFRSFPATKNVFIISGLSKRQAEQASLMR
ncbi:hypothetical protein HELRODRAFT_175876 [Helobdella robusta]|uniref:Uncharacterized protein n=1 Tax=Helobdella robusta TaxID=6412 RepID=T1F9T4_HELRO|nr:hypothetical protein HELRODRAFT_175876 [Helobdella robusta]ESO00444.1 hypothetical protein HELRODRAFT_175876 [Helobdella robusta]